MEPLQDIDGIIRTAIFNTPGVVTPIVLMEGLLGPIKGYYIWVLCKLKGHDISYGVKNEHAEDTDYVEDHKDTPWLLKLFKLKEKIEKWEVIDKSISKGRTASGSTYQCNYCWSRWDAKQNIIYAPVYIRSIYQHHGVDYDNKNFKEWQKSKSRCICPIHCQEYPDVAEMIANLTINFDRMLKYVNPDRIK
jgi:hypothetical protein